MKPLGIALAVALVGALMTTVAAAQSTPWKKGQLVPELRLPTIDGSKTIALSELRGKKVLLIEFASW